MKRRTDWRVSTSKSSLTGDNKDEEKQLDEVVIGDWFHLEMMNGFRGREEYWLRLGERTFYIKSYKGTTEIKEE